MDTTCYATDPLLDEPVETSPNPVGEVLFTVLFTSLALLVATTAGALMLHMMGPSLAVRTAPGFPLALAAATMLLLTVAVPLGLEALAHRRAREADPLARHPTRGALALAWNTALLLGLVFAAPVATRSALLARGDWAVRGYHGPAAESVRDAVHQGTQWLAGRIPAHSPVALTRGTGENALDRVAAANLTAQPSP